jgi:CheY-like chemotaxis protein
VSDRSDRSFPARVAHGINNPLTAVIANLDTALRELDGLPDKSASHMLIAERLGDARDAACRIHRVVLDLTRHQDSADAYDAQETLNVTLHASSLLPQDESTPSARRGRVLVVDDEQLITNAVRRLLSIKHDVTIASDGEEALSRMHSGERFDVIVCDLMMPSMTGMELHAQLRALAPDQASKMIFLTGGTFTDDARTFLDKSPNVRVEKPFDPRGLKALVDSHVR